MKRALCIKIITLFMLFGDFFAQPIWVVSGAPIGDKSKYLYPVGGITPTDQLGMYAINGEDSLEVFNISGNPEGVHIYAVTKQPNAICDITGLGTNDRYFGVFIASASSGPFTYDVNYFYGGNPFVDPNLESWLTLYHRPTNADTACVAWTPLAGFNDTVITKSIQVGTFGSSTAVWFEDFGTGGICTAPTSCGFFPPIPISSAILPYSTLNGSWTLQDLVGAPEQVWRVGSDEQNTGAGNCSDGCSDNGNNTLFTAANISFIPYGCMYAGATYENGSAANVRAISPIINLSGITSISMSYEYMHGNTGDIDDYGIIEISYDAGATWTPLVSPVSATSNTGCLGGNYQWAIGTLGLPAAADNNPNVRLGFRWVNDGDGVGNDPTFAVDNITLTTSAGTRQEFILGTRTPYVVLPYGYIMLTGNNFGQTNVLRWKFSGDIPIHHYHVIKITREGENLLAELSNNNNYYEDFETKPAKYQIIGITASGEKIKSNTVEITPNLEDKIEIYPNPVFTTLNVLYGGDEKIALKIYDITGRKLKVPLQAVNNSHYKADLSTLSKGTYLVEIYKSGILFHSQLIIKI